MARKTPEPAPIVAKSFSLEETQVGIQKLRRRIADVQALNPRELRYSDTEVDNVEHRIRETIRDVFGPASPEFHKHGHHIIWHGGIGLYDEEHERQEKFAQGIPQTVKLLEGLIAWLEEKAAELEASPVVRRSAAFTDLNLHPRIASVSQELFEDGHYPNAVFDASKALINYVKEKSGRYDLDGAALMHTVFSRKTPVLAFNDLVDQSDMDEQEGMMHLFVGAVLAIRNPRGHSFLKDSAERALQHLGLLSLLAYCLEDAKRIKAAKV